MVDEDEMVVLVDEQGQEVGTMEKLDAHRSGALHRAISIFVFDHSGRLILQRRAPTKYHSPGQWANTCCSHPRPGEACEDAAHRRLVEELGFDCALSYRAAIRYRADVGAGLTENELVSAYVGRHDGPLLPDPSEVSECRVVSTECLAREIAAEPQAFTPWLRIYVERHAKALFGDETVATE